MRITVIMAGSFQEALALVLEDTSLICLKRFGIISLTLQTIMITANSPAFAAGLGEGFGLEFPRLSLAVKNKLSSYEVTEEFAFGAGLGIGNIISRLVNKKSVYEEAKRLFGKKGNKFSEGFAIGFASGSIANILTNDKGGNNHNNNDNLLMLCVMSEAQKDAGFARSFGFGLAHIFSISRENERTRIIETIGRNEDFMTGLGAGIGYHLPSIGTRIVEEAIISIRSESFQKGLAIGFAASFKYLGMPEVLWNT